LATPSPMQRRTAVRSGNTSSNPGSSTSTKAPVEGKSWTAGSWKPAVQGTPRDSRKGSRSHRKTRICIPKRIGVCAAPATASVPVVTVPVRAPPGAVVSPGCSVRDPTRLCALAMTASTSPTSTAPGARACTGKCSGRSALQGRRQPNHGADLRRNAPQLFQLGPRVVNQLQTPKLETVKADFVPPKENEHRVTVPTVVLVAASRPLRANSCLQAPRALAPGVLAAGPALVALTRCARLQAPIVADPPTPLPLPYDLLHNRLARPTIIGRRAVFPHFLGRSRS